MIWGMLLNRDAHGAGHLAHFDVVQAACFDTVQRSVFDTVSGEEVPGRVMFALAAEAVTAWMDVPCSQWINGRRAAAGTCREVLQGWAQSMPLDSSHPHVGLAVLSPIDLLIVRGVWTTLAFPARRTCRNLVAAKLMAGLDEVSRIRRQQRQEQRQRRQRCQTGGDADLFLGDMVTAGVEPSSSSIVQADQAQASPVQAEAEDDTLAAAGPPSLQPSHLVQLALDLRKFSPAILSIFQGWEHEAQRAKLESTVEWLDSMVHVLSEGVGQHLHEKARGRASWRYTTKALLQALFLSSKLRDASSLKSVILSAMQLVLPDLTGAVQEELAAAPLPNKSTLSRARLICDVGYMLWHRRWLTSRIRGLTPLRPAAAGPDLAGASPEALGLTLDAVFVMADASPLGGREWLLTESTCVPNDQLATLFTAVAKSRTLTNERASVLQDIAQDDDGRQQELHHQVNELRKTIVAAAPASSGITNGRADGGLGEHRLKQRELRPTVIQHGSRR